MMHVAQVERMQARGMVRHRVLNGMGSLWLVGIAFLLGGCSSGGSGGETPPPAPPSPPVTLTVAKAGTGGGTITSAPAGVDCGTTCASTVAAGTVVTLTATPASGSTMGGWGGACSATSATCAVTVTADQTVTVSFAASTQTPSVSTTTSGTGSGSITCSANGGAAGACGTYAWGDQLSIVAAPASGSTFTGWSGGTCSGTATCAVTLTKNITVTATFVTGSSPPAASARLGAGMGYTLAVQADGRVLSIGSGMSYGGSGTAVPGTAAKVITGLSAISSVFANDFASNFAITTDGSVRGWGLFILGFMVTGPVGNTVDTPIAVPTVSQVTALSVCTSSDLFYALHRDGTVSYTPATISSGAGATKTITTQTIPSLSLVTSMSEHCTATGGQAVVVKTDGTVWSLSPSLTVNGSTTTYQVTVAQILGLPAITQVSCSRYGSGFCLARATDGAVWAWGDNASGQLGDGTTLSRTIPIQVPGLASIATVVAGFTDSYAMTTTGTIYSWGSRVGGFFGMLGRPITITTNSGVPGLVTLRAPAMALATSGTHTVAILNDGTLWSWGSNLKGELRDGTSGKGSESPVQAVGVKLN